LEDGRTVLSEEVPWPSISQPLQQLPAHTAALTPGSAGPASSEFAGLPPLPPLRAVSHAMNLLEIAQADYRGPGYQIDYNLSGSLSNFVFKGGSDDGTYFCSGIVSLYGTTVFEGNSVIKFTNSSSA